ncbi:MAG: Hint domain-containing protein [Roseobacter sp.]|jgi:hypothetical protein
MNPPSSAAEHSLNRIPDIHDRKGLVFPRPPKPAFGVRVADIAALNGDGQILVGQRRIPTLPQFDKAFAAFAQGTVFQAKHGFISVEDLQPGDWLMTANGKVEQVTWIGSATFSPHDHGDKMHLIRVMPDSFGISRPESYISLGNAARVLQTPYELKSTMGSTPMLTPIRHFLDGVNIIDVMPPTPVRLFHVGLRRHSAMIAGGLEVESYHPGENPVKDLSTTLRSVFLSLFPHVDCLSKLGGMAYTRAQVFEE